MSVTSSVRKVMAHRFSGHPALGEGAACNFLEDKAGQIVLVMKCMSGRNATGSRVDDRSDQQSAGARAHALSSCPIPQCQACGCNDRRRVPPASATSAGRRCSSRTPTQGAGGLVGMLRRMFFRYPALPYGPASWKCSPSQSPAQR